MPAAPHDSDTNTAPRAAARAADIARDAEDIRAGEVVADGRYQIEAVLGQGGMATVFRAKDLQRGREVALKVIARRYVGRPDREQRFENEGRFAGRLKGHRNIAAPLQLGRLGEHDGRMFLAMELARGPTLLDLVSMHGRLPVEDACAYVRDVARALRDLHASGVVHRDIKPSNVIVVETDEGAVAKLVDFGLAADAAVGGMGERLTKLDERPGTHHYMSPEQAWGAPAHPIFDVYALGVTFYELLVGEPPFHELDPGEVLRRKCDLSLPAPSVAAKRLDLPDGLAALVDGCLAPRASDRVPTANAFLARLDDIRAANGLVEGRGGEHTGIVGVARTIEEKKKAPRLRQIVADAAAAKAAGRPAPVEITPIRTGATRPEMAADRAALEEVKARGQSAGGSPAARGHTEIAEVPRGHTEAVIAATPRVHTAIATASADPRRPAGRAALWGLLAGAVVGAGAITAWWFTAQPSTPASAAAAASVSGDPVRAGVLSGDRSPADDVADSSVAASMGSVVADDAADAARDTSDAALDAASHEDGAAAEAGSAVEHADDAEAEDHGEVAADTGSSRAANDDAQGTASSPSSAADGGKSPTPSNDPWTPARCQGERASAEKALATGRFAGALGHTRIKKCWPEESARQKIRALAFFELLRYDDCIAAGKGSSDPAVQRTVRRCQKARDATP